MSIIFLFGGGASSLLLLSFITRARDLQADSGGWFPTGRSSQDPRVVAWRAASWLGRGRGREGRGSAVLSCQFPTTEFPITSANNNTSSNNKTHHALPWSTYMVYGLLILASVCFGILGSKMAGRSWVEPGQSRSGWYEHSGTLSE